MNIVYAVKIFAALTIVAMGMRMIAGPGLKLVLGEADLKKAMIGIIGTLAVSCFSARVALFFVALPIWVLLLSNLFGKDGSGRLPVYALLCCVSPAMTLRLGDIGPLHDVLLLTPFRILGLFLLLPEAVRLIARREVVKVPFWLRACDILVVSNALWWFGRHFAVMSASTLGRELVAQVLDTLLPYYVLTRGCVDPARRHRVLAFFLVGAVYESFVGLAESLSRHYLYSQLQWLYGVGFAQSTGLMRGSWLRAEAAFIGPLALAMLSLFGIGLWFALKPPEQDKKNKAYRIVLVALVGSLLATYGRGPILACFILFSGVWLLRRVAGKRYLAGMLVLTIAFTVTWTMGVGDAVTASINAASAGDPQAEFNLRYRQELLDVSLALLKQSPWFGVPNYIQQMESLRQGEGIIDLVNTYLVVALNTGLFGIFLVFTPFVTALWRDASSVRGTDASAREALAWIPLTLAFMAAIFTVSPVSIMQPMMVWVIAIPLARQQQRLQAGAGRDARLSPGLSAGRYAGLQG